MKPKGVLSKTQNNTKQPQQPSQPFIKKPTEIKKKTSSLIVLKNPKSSDKIINQINESSIRSSQTTIQIVIKKSNELQDKFQKLTNKLKNSEKGSKIKLILKTFVEDDDAMYRLQTSFFKDFVEFISYLEWEITGKFTDSGQAKAIGDILGRLVNLYSLNLFIKETYFADKGAAFLSAGLNKLKKLRFLKINLQEIHNQKHSNKLTRKGGQLIMKTISGMAELQILQQNIQPDVNPYPPHLVGLGFPLYWYLYCNGNAKILQWITDKKHLITEIIINSYDLYDYEEDIDFNNNEFSILSQLFIELFSLPYLTRFSLQLLEFLDNKTKDLHKLQGIVSRLAAERYNTILGIIAFDSTISNLIPLNPKLILLDMLFD